MSTRYTGIPELPQVGVDEWQIRMLAAIKENLELLTGTRGEGDLNSKALTRTNVTLNTPPAQVMTNVGATGAGTELIASFELTGPAGGPFTVNITGRASVPTLEDYSSLIINVQELANDVANVRAVLELLITQLKA